MLMLNQDITENTQEGSLFPDREVLYAIVVLLRGSNTGMQVGGFSEVRYSATPGNGVCFLAELWHRTVHSEPGTVKLTLFFGRWLVAPSLSRRRRKRKVSARA